MTAGQAGPAPDGAVRLQPVQVTAALMRRLRRIRALSGQTGPLVVCATLPLPPGAGLAAAALCAVFAPQGAVLPDATHRTTRSLPADDLPYYDILVGQDPPILRLPLKLTNINAAPLWHDPCRDALCDLSAAMNQHQALLRAYDEDGAGHVALGVRRWKRPALRRFFGRFGHVTFCNDPCRAVALARASHRPLLVWGDRPLPDPQGLPLRRVEDGFLRSRGLGADLVPPLSLITDDLGLPFDPRRESRLDHLIRAPLPPGGRARAQALIARLIQEGISKYNLPADLPPLPDPARPRILVVGQVEDDAALRLGGGAVRGNLALLRAARAAHPDAFLIYKPHPDVEAGLRPGAIAPDPTLADLVAHRAHPLHLIDHCDAVWTMTSLLGFEALLRGKPVTCLGMPFYAGWGLTTDHAPRPPWRQAGVDVIHLAHAALIDYPRYIDPVSRLPCPPEVVLDRLTLGQDGGQGPLLRLLSWAQRRLARHSRLWR